MKLQTHVRFPADQTLLIRKLTDVLREHAEEINKIAPSAALPVASLPAAAVERVGSRYIVSDANATTFASVVAAGGANVVPVYCDGTNWRIG